MIFWDSSVLVKCYFAGEAGHARARNLLTTRERHLGSPLLWPEAASGIVRRLSPDRRRIDSALGLLEDHLKRFDLLALTDDQCELAVRLIRAHALRFADAMHLVAALIMSRVIGRGRIHFATADHEQAEAARAERLKVIDLAG